MTFSKKSLLFFASMAVSIALIYAIHTLIGWDKLLHPWQSLAWTDTLLVLCGLMLSYAIRATRIVHHFGLFSLKDFLLSARLMVLHNFWNNLLPMRSGEAAFPVLMKTHFAMPLSQSIPALFWMRILDLQVLLLIALLTLGSIWLDSWVIVTLLLIGLSGPFVLFGLHHQFLRNRQNLPNLIQKLDQGMPTDMTHIVWGSFWTWVNWLIKIAALAWVLSWFIELPLQQTLMGVIGGEFSSVLPIHGVAGMGTYEAGVLLGFGEGFAQIEALLIAAVNLHLILFGSSLLAAVLAYLTPKGHRHDS